MNALAWGVRWVRALTFGAAMLWPGPGASVARTESDAANEASIPRDGAGTEVDAAAWSGTRSSSYRLDDLVLVRRAIDRVADSYVEPSRVDPEAMYVGALEAVERALPGATLRRTEGRLALQLGAWHGALEVPRVRRLEELTQRLVQVAALVRAHVGPDGVGGDDARLDPFVQVEIAMANGALATLDPHSVLLSPAAWREMEVENAGEFGGLGVQVRQVDGRMVLEHVVPGTPAARAGLAAGDVLRRVDGAPLINLPFDDAVELLRGPVGAPVRLEVERASEGGAAVNSEVTVYRASIPTAPVEVAMLQDRVAVARVRSFHADVADDVREALAVRAAEAGGVRAVVLDLRGNPGGYLTQAVRLADLFLAEGEIVSTRSARDPAPRPERASPATAEQGLAVAESVPLVVLVDAGSASASEIVAGAIARNDRGVLVGERTFGKGSVQNLLPMPLESRLKLTIAHYLTPGGRSIQEAGVEPDIELLPVWITPDEGGADVLVHGHQRARREADLAAHLAPWRSDEPALDDAPSWSCRYLGAVERPGDPPADERAADPSRDAPLRLALDLLGSNLRSATAARTGSGLLAATGGAVAASGARLEAEVAAGMTRAGVDWSAGPCPPAVTLDVRVDGPGEGLTLPAGRESAVTLVARRAWDDVGGDAHRVVAVLEGHPLLEGVEFPLGRLRPGQEVRWTAHVSVPAGAPAELGRARVVWRDEEGRALGDAPVAVAVTGPPHPVLAWSVAVDGREAGDAGAVAVGRPTRLLVSVRNLGATEVDGAVLRLRSRAGAALDVLDGVVRIDGLAPGATLDASFTVLPVAPLDAGWPLEVVLTDTGRPAVAAEAQSPPIRPSAPASWVLRAGPAPLGPVVERVPPSVSWSRALGLTSAASAVSASGMVSDDGGLSSLIVYHGADKVLAMEGGLGAGVPQPFQFDLTLRPGRNVLSVLAVDAQGAVTLDQRVVWLESP